MPAFEFYNRELQDLNMKNAESQSLKAQLQYWLEVGDTLFHEIHTVGGSCIH